LYLYNWKIAYMCVGVTVATWAVGYPWMMMKRKRYDRFFEKCRDPEHIKWVKEKTILEPGKYMAFLKQMQEDIAVIKEKYQN